MKKINNWIAGMIAGLLLFAAGTVVAQGNNNSKADKLIFLNGMTKEGKVTSFTNETVQFVYRGETLKYEFSKKEIEKIEYASGRSESINEKKVTTVFSGSGDTKNKVAVLPLIYIGDDNDSRTEAMRFHLQDIAINFLSRSAAELKFMDAAEINAQLRKKNIDDSNIREYTPKELAELLGVEYIIMGDVLQDRGNIVTTTNSRNTRRQTRDDYHGWSKTVRRNDSHGSTVTRQNIETQVTLSIYNETGQKIYTKSRQSILSEQDAYKNAIHYLLKRTPLYKR